MKTLLPLAAFAGLALSANAATIITPTSVTATVAFGSWTNTINGIGLSGLGASGDILSETHVLVQGGAFALLSGGPDYTGESMTFTVAAPSTVNQVHLWLEGGTWGAITGFDLEFSTDNGLTFPTSVALTTAFNHLASDLTKVQTQAFAAQTGVTHIRLSNVDVDGDVDTAGEPAYAGFNEIRFGYDSIPEPSAASLLGGLGTLLLLRRRRA